MPRSKEDFLSYARRKSTGGNARRSDEYSANNNETDADTSVDLRGTTSGDDGTTEGEYRGSETEQRTDSWVATGESSSNGNQPEYYTGDSGGVEELDGSGYDSSDFDGGYDIPIRNYPSNDYRDYQPVQQPATGRKRVSFIDNFLGKTVNRPKKAAPQKAVSTVRKLITLAEVAKYRPGMIKLIMFSSDHMDDGISAITKGHRQVLIWSTIEMPDAEVLADAFLEAGQKSAAVAERVRWVMEWEKKLQVGIILAPRIYRSIVYVVVTGISFQL